MPITTINNVTELVHYNAELAAAQAEVTLLVFNDDYHRQLTRDIHDLEEQINLFNASKNRKKKQPVEENLEQYLVTPLARQLWPALLGVGIIIQETLIVATAIVESFLFPLHFAIDGLRSMWDLRRLSKDKTIANRNLQLAATVFNLVGVGVAAILVGLAVSNPFALPAVFIGIVGAVMAKDVYLLKQNKIAINDLKMERATVAENIIELQQAIKNEAMEPAVKVRHQARLKRLEAKHARLDSQLTHLRAQRSELRRNVFFHTLSIIAVGLLVTAAVASLFFPPVAIAIAGAGFLLFAAVSISNVLSSPPVRAKMADGMSWFNNKLGFKKSDYAPVAGNELQSEAVVSPIHPAGFNMEDSGVSSTQMAPQKASAPFKNSSAGLRFFDHETRLNKTTENNIVYPFRRSQSLSSFFKPAQNEQIQVKTVVQTAQTVSARRLSR